MAELSLRDRLQPALLDRLIDDERLVTVFEFAFRRDELHRLGFAERVLADILQGQGLRAMPVKPAVTAAGEGEQPLRMTFASPGGRVTLAQIKGLTLKPPARPGAPMGQPPTGQPPMGQGIALAAFCEISARNVPNETVESGDRTEVPMRKLREYVCRDLGALLNSNSLEISLDLTAYPLVQRSVLNFGMPSLAGRMARSVEPQKTAATIEEVIRRFEPRLSKVRVTPEVREGGGEQHVLAFRIEAELWGQPVPQQLVLRTSIDIDSGDVSIADSGVK
jgi:type VI secretion system protein ImpF